MTTQQVLDKQGLQHYATKMCNAENRKVGSKSLPTALNDIDTAIDGFKTLFDNEYGTPVTATIENNSNIFTIGKGNGIDKSNDIENGFSKITLYGDTLHNICKKHDPIIIKGDYSHTTSYFQQWIPLSYPLKPSTLYTFIINITNNTGNPAFSSIILGKGESENSDIWANRVENTDFTNGLKNIGTDQNCFFVATKSTSSLIENTNFTNIGIIAERMQFDAVINSIMILEGDWTQNLPYKYFEDIKSFGEGKKNISIKSTKKNIVKIDKIDYFAGWGNHNLTMIDNGFKFSCPKGWNTIGSTIPLLQNKKITVSADVSCKINDSSKNTTQEFAISNVRFAGARESFKNNETKRVSFTFVPSQKKINFYGTSNPENIGSDTSIEWTVTNIQVELAESSSNYEKYEEYIKKIDLPIQDGIKKLSSEISDSIEYREDGIYLIQRVGKYCVTGNEDWIVSGNTNDSTFVGALAGQSLLNAIKTKNSFALVNNFKQQTSGAFKSRSFSIYNLNSDGTYNALAFGLEKSICDNLDKFKEWLKKNPTVVYYELPTPIENKIANGELIQYWKEGSISILDEVLPVTTTHTVALNKTAQIQSNIEELTSLRNRVQKIEEQYNSTVLTQAYETILLNFDMNL